jgi:hypothetical protein
MAATLPKRAASLQVAAKIATGFVERLDRILDALFAFLLPGPRFCPQRGSRG